MSYTAEERESHLNSNDETKSWSCYTLMPTMISKFKRAGFTPDKVDADGAHYYSNIPHNCISIRSDNSKNKTKRVMTDEHKAKLRAGREAKKQ